MADLSVKALARIGYTAAERVHHPTGPLIETWEQTLQEERDWAVAFTQAVLAALAEAGGSPEALGRIAWDAGEAEATAHGHGADITWEQTDATIKRVTIAEAQAVAAFAVAAVREREVGPLRKALGDLQDEAEWLASGRHNAATNAMAVRMTEIVEAALGVKRDA